MRALASLCVGLLAACTAASPTTPSPQPTALSLACPQWLALGEPGRAPGEETEQQIALAGAITDAEQLLEGVRSAQRAPLDTPRDALVDTVAASFTKWCLVTGEAHRSLVELARGTYRCYDRHRSFPCPRPSPSG